MANVLAEIRVYGQSKRTRHNNRGVNCEKENIPLIFYQGFSLIIMMKFIPL